MSTVLAPKPKAIRYQTPSKGVEQKELSDSDLMTLHLLGDERAFTKLYERYTTRLLNFIYRVIGDRERAEDLVQETFVRVDRSAHRFDQSKKFSTWVYTIAANLSKNELRNRSRSPLTLFQALRTEDYEEEERPIEFEDTTTRPDDLYRKRQLRELVEQTVMKLPERFREVFVLRELHGLSYDEMALIIHSPLGTLKSRLSRARTAFAALIEPYVD